FGEPAVPSLTTTRAWITNIALFVAFGVHHSVLARRSVKTIVRSHLTPEVERSLYVWIASVLFFVMMWAWQRFPCELWRLDGRAAWVVHGVQLAGAVMGIAAGRRVDVRELAGLGPTLPAARTPSEPVQSGPYRVVRHPLYLAFLVLIWAVAVMTVTRLLF